MATVVILDGEVLDPEVARIPVFDHGFLFGDSVYDVIRTRRGEPELLEEHVARLRRSAAEIYLELPFTDAELMDEVRRGIRRAGNAESYVRIVVTRGVGQIELHPRTCARPTLLLIVAPLVPPPARMYEEGVRLAIVERRRTPPRSLDPRAKTGNYLNNVLAIIEARRRGADDAIMLNAEGHLTEGTTANVFMVRDGRVLTPALESGILQGITRGRVIDLLSAEGYRVEEALLAPDDLRGADEAFITSTTRDVMPVGRVDDVTLAPVPGPVTARLAAILTSR